MPERPAYRIYKGFWSFIDLLFPPSCAGCDTQGTQWCVSCQEKVHRLSGPICKRCGIPLHTEDVENCPDCLRNPPYYKELRSYAYFEGPIRNAIHKLKYKGEISLGFLLAEKLIDSYRKWNWQVDLIVPVPLGVARLSERGYNQAALLARPLALYLGIPFQSHGLMRLRETRSQVGLSYEQRLENVRYAFSARNEIVAGRKVLIVDDVATSSATIDACAQAIHESGGLEVYGLTVARAGLHQHVLNQEWDDQEEF